MEQRGVGNQGGARRALKYRSHVAGTTDRLRQNLSRFAPNSAPVSAIYSPGYIASYYPFAEKKCFRVIPRVGVCFWKTPRPTLPTLIAPISPLSSPVDDAILSRRVARNLRRLAFFVGSSLLCAASPASTPALVRTEFAPASRPSGQTLFTRLDPAATGLVVQNPYDDPQMWGTRYREFMGGGMGSGVAAGDFDGDGKVDLYVCTKTRPGRLYRNLGDWKFEDVTDRMASEHALLGKKRRLASRGGVRRRQ